MKRQAKPRWVSVLPGSTIRQPNEVISATIEVDSQGRAFSGAHAYLLHISREQSPPTRGYWSITILDQRGLPVDNVLRRFSIGDRNCLTFNEDGSLDIAVQHEWPGAARESNWLPAPRGPFQLVLTIYWPLPQVTDGTWQLPPIRRLGD
jgi:hypothetical protein